MEAAAKRSVYFPVFYVEPCVGNELALGFDLDTVICSLYDRTALPGKQLLWAHQPEKQDKPHTPPGYPRKTDTTGGWFSSEFDVGGRNWTIKFAPTTGYLAMYDFWGVWVILAGGLLFTGVTGYLLLALHKRSAALAATNVSMRTEIAERILAETKMRDSEKRYRALVSNLDTGVIVNASDTRILLANYRAQGTFMIICISIMLRH